jgi:ribosome modulation factor
MAKSDWVVKDGVGGSTRAERACKAILFMGGWGQERDRTRNGILGHSNMLCPYSVRTFIADYSPHFLHMV